MPGRLAVYLLSALAWGAVSNARVPADPTITAPALLPRQNDDDFIGWVEFSGTWFSETCSYGLTWFQDGNYAQCCPTTATSCFAPTACTRGYQVYPLTEISTETTIACTDNYDNPAWTICNTVFIFENFDDSDPRTNIVCGKSSMNWSYYRRVPATATEEVIVSSEAPSLILESAASEVTGSDDSEPTRGGGGDGENEDSDDDGGSKAWIAGAVVGPIIGLALIGGLIFFFLRRKKKNKSQPQHGTPMAMAGNQPPSGPQNYGEAKPVGVAQFSPQPSQQTVSGYNSPNASAYNQQQGYVQTPTSPVPQYSSPFQSPGSPPPPQGYSAPGSPPPPGHYAPDAKYTYNNQISQSDAVELGATSGPMSPTQGR